MEENSNRPYQSLEHTGWWVTVHSEWDFWFGRSGIAYTNGYPNGSSSSHDNDSHYSEMDDDDDPHRHSTSLSHRQSAASSYYDQQQQSLLYWSDPCPAGMDPLAWGLLSASLGQPIRRYWRLCQYGTAMTLTVYAWLFWSHGRLGCAGVLVIVYVLHRTAGLTVCLEQAIQEGVLDRLLVPGYELEYRKEYGTHRIRVRPSTQTAHHVIAHDALPLPTASTSTSTGMDKWRSLSNSNHNNYNNNTLIYTVYGKFYSKCGAARADGILHEADRPLTVSTAVWGLLDTTLYQYHTGHRMPDRARYRRILLWLVLLALAGIVDVNNRDPAAAAGLEFRQALWVCGTVLLAAVTYVQLEVRDEWAAQEAHGAWERATDELRDLVEQHSAYTLKYGMLPALLGSVCMIKLIPKDSTSSTSTDNGFYRPQGTAV